MHCIALHYTVLHCTALNCTALLRTVIYCTALCCSAVQCTALHCTTEKIKEYRQKLWIPRKNQGRFLTPHKNQEPNRGRFLTPKKEQMKEPRKKLIQEPKAKNRTESEKLASPIGLAIEEGVWRGRGGGGCSKK